MPPILQPQSGEWPKRRWITWRACACRGARPACRHEEAHLVSVVEEEHPCPRPATTGRVPGDDARLQRREPLVARRGPHQRRARCGDERLERAPARNRNLGVAPSDKIRVLDPDARRDVRRRCVVVRKRDARNLGGGLQRLHAHRRGHLVQVPKGVDQLHRQTADVAQQRDLDTLDVEVRRVGRQHHAARGEERGMGPQKVDQDGGVDLPQRVRACEPSEQQAAHEPGLRLRESPGLHPGRLTRVYPEPCHRKGICQGPTGNPESVHNIRHLLDLRSLRTHRHDAFRRGG